MTWFLPSRCIFSSYQQGEVGTRRPQDSRQWNDHEAKFNDVRDGDEDYDDYDKDGNDKGNMDWDSIGDFSQYPKAAGSDVSRVPNPVFKSLGTLTINTKRLVPNM